MVDKALWYNHVQDSTMAYWSIIHELQPQMVNMDISTIVTLLILSIFDNIFIFPEFIVEYSKEAIIVSCLCLTNLEKSIRELSV
jgi:hypothetical protein